MTDLSPGIMERLIQLPRWRQHAIAEALEVDKLAGEVAAISKRLREIDQRLAFLQGQHGARRWQADPDFIPEHLRKASV